MVEYKNKCLLFSSLLNMNVFLCDEPDVINPLIETNNKNTDENVPQEEREEEKKEDEEWEKVREEEWEREDDNDEEKEEEKEEEEKNEEKEQKNKTTLEKIYDYIKISSIF